MYENVGVFFKYQDFDVMAVMTVLFWRMVMTVCSSRTLYRNVLTSFSGYGVL